MSVARRRLLVEQGHPGLTIQAQCRLLDLSVSSLYYKPEPLSEEDHFLMRRLDAIYLETPFYGVRRMAWQLRQEGLVVNEKRVRRLMRLMRLEAIYPKPRLSLPGEGVQIYPYLLRGMSILAPDVVWATDITYVRLRRGFVYLRCDELGDSLRHRLGTLAYPGRLLLHRDPGAGLGDRPPAANR